MKFKLSFPCFARGLAVVALIAFLYIVGYYVLNTRVTDKKYPQGKFSTTGLQISTGGNARVDSTVQVKEQLKEEQEKRVTYQ